MDWMLWAPFQSDEVRDICAHLTRRERDAALGLAGAGGLKAGLIAPMFVVASHNYPTWWAWMVAAAGLVVLLMVLRRDRQRWRTFLTATEWARARGTSQNIRLFQLW
jgi:hypothetical protein